MNKVSFRLARSLCRRTFGNHKDLGNISSSQAIVYGVDGSGKIRRDRIDDRLHRNGRSLVVRCRLDNRRIGLCLRKAQLHDRRLGGTITTSKGKIAAHLFRKPANAMKAGIVNYSLVNCLPAIKDI